MRFQGSGRPLTRDGFYTALGRLRVDPAALWALLIAESGGFGFTPDRRPKICFDSRIFHRITDGESSVAYCERCDALVHAGGNRSGDYHRFDLALALDDEAALASASWGIGGVAGFHATSIGFTSTARMIAEMVAGEDAQLAALVRRIEEKHVERWLRHHEWDTFTRDFKGREGVHNGFAIRLESAYRRAERLLPDLTVRAVQAALLYSGFDPGPVDGVIGPRTLGALSDYALVPRAVRGLFVGAGTLLRQMADEALRLPAGAPTRCPRHYTFSSCLRA